MKRLIPFLLLFLVAWSGFADDHTVEPFFKGNDWSISGWGFANITGGTKVDTRASQLRYRIYGNNSSGFSFFLEADIAGVIDHSIQNPSYLTQAWVAYTHKEPLLGDKMFSESTIRGGRFQIAGFYDMPGAFFLPTIANPVSNPFPAYGTGVQFSTKILPNLKFLADVTTRDGQPFPVNELKDQRIWVETSEWLQWKATDTLSLSLTNHSSEYFQRNGFGVVYKPFESLTLKGNVYLNNENIPELAPVHYWGGYGQAEYTLYKFQSPRLDLKIHGLVEGMSGTKNYSGETAGVMLELPEGAGWGRFGGSSATVDYTHSNLQINNGPEIVDNPVMFRIRVGF